MTLATKILNAWNRTEGMSKLSPFDVFTAGYHAAFQDLMADAAPLPIKRIEALEKRVEAIEAREKSLDPHPSYITVEQDIDGTWIAGRYDWHKAYSEYRRNFTIGAGLTPEIAEQMGRKYAQKFGYEYRA